MIKICKCLETKSSHKVERVFHFDRYVLEGGGFTSFMVFQCCDCGAFGGFPPSNFEIALKEGTAETKTMLGLIPKFPSMRRYGYLFYSD